MYNSLKISLKILGIGVNKTVRGGTNTIILDQSIYQEVADAP